MLVLTRKQNEKIKIGDDIVVKAVSEEQYELAAQLRDELEQREIGPR